MKKIIKQEENKLLDIVNEFHSTEQSLIKEKNIRLQNLESIKTFCSISQEKLRSKEETDEESMDIRKKCEDCVVNLNDLQNQILIVKTPHHR
ncbi:unnamed protein product, partial [Adineta steineri]